MQDKGCSPDSILYSALLEALWDTGIPWAQAKAGQLFRAASRQGHFKKMPEGESAAVGCGCYRWQCCGNVGAQARAGQLFRATSKKQPEGESAVALLISPGMAMQQAAPSHVLTLSPPPNTHTNPHSTASGAPRSELALQQLSPGMVMLALHCWLADLRWGAFDRGLTGRFDRGLTGV